jgi:hypothetical protein
MRASAHPYATYCVLHYWHLSTAAGVKDISETLGKNCAAMELQTVVLFSNELLSSA